MVLIDLVFTRTLKFRGSILLNCALENQSLSCFRRTFPAVYQTTLSRKQRILINATLGPE